MANLTLESLQKQIGELKNEVKILKGNPKDRVIPAGLRVGDTFKLAGLTWKILEITEKGYACLADKLEERMKFDSSSNNWQTSGLREYLNTEFYKQLADAIGVENIIPFERDLLSIDGQTEYGKCEDKVSLLTVDEYRKYRGLIPNTGDYWWWTITPDSTKCNDNTTWVTAVSSSGNVDFSHYYDCCGVRPFCILKSNIFVTKAE